MKHRIKVVDGYQIIQHPSLTTPVFCFAELLLSSQQRHFIFEDLVVGLLMDAEYPELPMEGTLEFLAVVCTYGLDLKNSEDDFVGNMFFQHSRRVANGF